MIRWILRELSRRVVSSLLSKDVLLKEADAGFEGKQNKMFIEAAVMAEFDTATHSAEGRVFLWLIRIFLLSNAVILLWHFYVGHRVESEKGVAVFFGMLILISTYLYQKFTDLWDKKDVTALFLALISLIANNLFVISCIAWVNSGLLAFALIFAVLIATLAAIMQILKSAIRRAMDSDLSLEESGGFVKVFRNRYSVSAMRKIVMMTMEGETFSYRQLIELQDVHKANSRF